MGFLNYIHILFIHILSTTFFFAYAIMGMIWEHKSLISENKQVILHTYKTITWLDARLSLVLLILSIGSGIYLTLQNGGLLQNRWLLVAFILFIFSGVIWIVSDIPTQYKVKRILQQAESGDDEIPPELIKLQKLRLWISIAGVTPLLVVFYLMVFKPSF